MNFIGLLRTLEAMSRPPRLGHDLDLEDGAAHLAEREAEEEVSEPEDDSLACPYPDCARYVDHRGPHEFPWGDSIPWPPEADLNDDVTPNTEPGLTSDELVGVRGVLQERYEERGWAACRRLDDELERLGIHKSSASVNSTPGVDAGPAPSPTIVQSAPPPTVDGEGPPEVSGHSPVPPSEGRPDGDCFDYCVGHPEDAAAEWIGWAVPAICTVLHEHRPFQRRPIATEDDGRVYCSDEAGTIHRRFDDYQAWLEHVAPIIAEAVAPQPK